MTDWTIDGLAAAIRERKISAVEVTTECLERIGRLDGRLRAFITVDAGGSARLRPGPRRRRGGGPLARGASRRAAGLQGPLPYPRPADLVRDQDGRVLHRRARRDGGEPLARGGRDHAGQAQHDGAGPRSVRRQCASRARGQSLARRPPHRRLVERIGRRRRRRARARRARHGHGRLDPAARRMLRHRRAQAHLRAGEPRRGHALVLVQ